MQAMTNLRNPKSIELQLKCTSLLVSANRGTKSLKVSPRSDHNSIRFNKSRAKGPTLLEVIKKWTIAKHHNKRMWKGIKGKNCVKKQERIVVQNHSL